ncbi:hypothetical protein TYRP_015087 [Tyrophagus putrescentiae]|nr:hypothetical protein TYRP_015087 [Tyrophagus putrescentiae]
MLRELSVTFCACSERQEYPNEGEEEVSSGARIPSLRRPNANFGVIKKSKFSAPWRENQISWG